MPYSECKCGQPISSYDNPQRFEYCVECSNIIMDFFKRNHPHLLDIAEEYLINKQTTHTTRKKEK